MKGLTNKNNRNYSIDVLRWIALTGIILAHIEPPEFWFQIRQFDVPLMVFLSGICFSSFSSKHNSYTNYCIKRFKRLIIPCWIFLTLYFSFNLLFHGKSFSGSHLIMCYTLTTPWYLWIIRVLFLIALLSPYISQYVEQQSIKKLLILTTILLIINEVFTKIIDNYWFSIMIMMLPYSIIFATGILMKRLERKKILLLSFIFFSIYIALAILIFYKTGLYKNTQIHKYPPRLYYMSYAWGVILLLYSFRDSIVHVFEKIGILKSVCFIGSHTLWIYLWHIPFVELVNGRFNSIIRFFFVYFSAILIVIIQDLIVQKFLNSSSLANPTKKDIKLIFIG